MKNHHPNDGAPRTEIASTTGKPEKRQRLTADTYIAAAQSQATKHGYAADNDIAFFPGWPLVLRAFASLGVPMLWAGVGLAMICSAFAAAALPSTISSSKEFTPA